MRKIPTALMLVLFVASAQGARADDNQWLMMVVTNNTDPTREAEFNHWYNDIDLPDVFTVPGYMRARRGQGQPVPEFPSADLQPDEGRYVALYDITSNDIDGTIINMLLLARKMDNTGRSTDLLKVTERLYFRRYGPAQEAPALAATQGNPYLFLVRVDCCADETTTTAFNAWYDGTALPDLLQAPGVQRATRYVLHRVVMSDPIAVPLYLTLFELEAPSATDAVDGVQKAMDALRAAGRLEPNYREDGATIYLKITDAYRPGGNGK
jgi:hypothetical protein